MNCLGVFVKLLYNADLFFTLLYVAFNNLDMPKIRYLVFTEVIQIFSKRTFNWIFLCGEDIYPVFTMCAYMNKSS